MANINNYMDTPTKPLQKLEMKDMVAQIANIKSTNCFLQTNSPNITLAKKYSCTVAGNFCGLKISWIGQERCQPYISCIIFTKHEI